MLFLSTKALFDSQIKTYGINSIRIVSPKTVEGNFATPLVEHGLFSLSMSYIVLEILNTSKSILGIFDC